MSHLLDRTVIARIRIQAEFEDIYSKTDKFIQATTVRDNKNELKTLRDELKKLCDDYCTKSEKKFKDIDRLIIEEEMCVKVIGNLKKNNSQLYQHLTIKVHHTVSIELMNDIRGVINATVSQINYIIAQNNYIIAQNSYITAQNNYTNTIVQNNNTIAKNNNKINNNKKNTIAKNNNAIAQNNNIIAENNKTIAQNSNTSAQSSNTIAQNSYTIAQNNYTIDEVKFSLVLTDTPEDTCTSFVYSLKCSICYMYYVGRTHYGEQKCFNKITADTKANINRPVYKHMLDARHTFKIDDMQKVFSCYEDNKLKILESLLIKRYIVRGMQVLDIKGMKQLTIFQYTADELNKAMKQLTEHDRLGIARSNESILHEFEKSNDGKVRNNDTELTLLQAEFENFYDITQIFIENDKETKNKYITGLRAQYNIIAASSFNQKISWNKVVIGNIKYKGDSCNSTVESRQNNLAIKLPDTEYSYEKMKTAINDLLYSSMEAKYKLEESDKPEDTRTSIVYLMKCKKSDCKRDLYIGLTNVGKEKRYIQHTKNDTKSAVNKHIKKGEGHGFNKEDMKILEVCCDDNKLEFLESLYIKEYLLNEEILKGKDGILNRKRGKVLSLFAPSSKENDRIKSMLNQKKKHTKKETEDQEEEETKEEETAEKKL